MQFHFKDILTYQQQLKIGTETVTRVVQYYLQQIENKKGLNAFVHVFEEAALARAQELDALKDASTWGPLHGIVIAIKDVFCYQNHPVSAASKMLNGFHSLFTATAVQRLVDAGAVIIGTTNCDEFAMGSTNENSVYGPVKNAADLNRVSGGSSGGSAVAVQAGLCMASLGSDTGGSVRQPADFCGVFGLKPSYGRISRYGLIAYASSFDCVGFFTTNLSDTAILYNVMAGPDGYDSTCLTQPPQPLPKASSTNTSKTFKIAVLEPTIRPEAGDPEIIGKLKESMDLLKKAGNVVDLIPFSLLEYVVPCYYVLTTAEASSNLSRYDGIRYGHRSTDTHEDLASFYLQNRSQGFGLEVKRRILLGSFVLSSGYFDAYFTKAQQVRQRICEETAGIFKEYDLLLMPVSPSVAPRLNDMSDDPVAMYMADIYTVFANLAGIPGMAMPLATHSNGMPFGLQVLAGMGNEVILHQGARQISEVCGSLL